MAGRFDDPLTDAVNNVHDYKRSFELQGERRDFRLAVAFYQKSEAHRFADRVREEGRKPCKRGGYARVIRVLHNSAWAVYRRCRV